MLHRQADDMEVTYSEQNLPLHHAQMPQHRGLVGGAVPHGSGAGPSHVFLDMRPSERAFLDMRPSERASPGSRPAAGQGGNPWFDPDGEDVFHNRWEEVAVEDFQRMHAIAAGHRHVDRRVGRQRAERVREGRAARESGAERGGLALGRGGGKPAGCLGLDLGDFGGEAPDVLLLPAQVLRFLCLIKQAVVT